MTTGTNFEVDAEVGRQAVQFILFSWLSPVVTTYTRQPDACYSNTKVYLFQSLDYPDSMFLTWVFALFSAFLVYSFIQSFFSIKRNGKPLPYAPIPMESRLLLLGHTATPREHCPSPAMDSGFSEQSTNGWPRWLRCSLRWASTHMR